MNSQNYTPQHMEHEGAKHTHPSQERSRKKKRAVMYAVLILACTLAWVGITVQVLIKAKQYVDVSVEKVHRDNVATTKQIQEKVDALSDDVDQLNQSLSHAGVSISSSKDVQKRIDDRLQSLDKQLKDLEKSLKVLKEAP